MPRKAKVISRRRPGLVRDAIVSVLSAKPRGATVAEIEQGVRGLIGDAPGSSIRSYLRLNTDFPFFRREFLDGLGCVAVAAN